jgi:hypothetical protein
MEEAPENGKELSHSAHANGTNEWTNEWKALYTVKIFFRWNKNGACKIQNLSYRHMRKEMKI